MATVHATVEETAGGGSLAWHTAPVRQLVVTLAGELLFSTRDGEQFTLRPGDVLLAEDVSGSGHQWSLRGTDPWRRMYVVLAPGTEVPFVSG
jgi:quercetin dioxygenase-like cupin family protein